MRQKSWKTSKYKQLKLIMMKYFKFMIIALAATWMFSGCGSKKSDVPANDSDSISQADVMAQDSTLYGICGEGTAMNTLQLITDDGDTLMISTVQCNDKGLILGGLTNGDKLAVMLAKDANGVKTATSVVNLTTLLGAWVEPNPIDGSSVQGFKLQEGGIASSINMSTRTYKTWKMFNGKLLLTSVSDGSGSPEEGTDTFSIKTSGPDSWVVSHSETTFEYT